MSDESMNSLEDLLDQHDYEMPQVGDIRTGVIVAITGQGLIIDLGLKRDGIVPQSDLAKLEDEERDALKVNDEVPVYVVQTEDPEALVVSIHLARLNQDWYEAEQVMQSGAMYEGEVIGYNKGGVIVPFGRIRGFVPISHMSDITPGMGERRRQQRLARLRGETIAVKVIEVDRQRHRLVMSQRDAQKEWEEKRRGELMETLNPGDVLSGRISGMRDFGAFVDLGGADGLVHISELSWHRIEHPREVVKLGDEVEVYVLGIDKESGRISLSRKKLLANPWDTVAQRYTQNELVEGKITRILEYGAFAEIEPGVEGLLHVSQLSRNAVENPREVVQEGEVHLLRIVSIDQKRQRIGLSLKAVTPTEQIEWMAQKELAEAMQREEEEAAAAARAARQTVDAGAEAPVETGASEMTVEDSAELEAVVTDSVDVAESEVSEDAGEAVDVASVEAVETVEEPVVESVSETADTVVEEAAEKVGEVAEAVTETVAEAVESVTEAVDKVTETATDTVGEVVEVAAETVGEVAETASDTVDEVVESAIDTVGELLESTTETAGELIESAADTVDTETQAAIDDVVDSVEEPAGEFLEIAEEIQAEESDQNQE